MMNRTCVIHPAGCPDGGRVQVAYSRLSLNRTEKDSVARGIADMRNHAERRGNHIVAEFTDDDVSAWSGKKRNGYSQMLAFIAEHANDVNDICIPHSSRLTRNNRQRTELFAQLVKWRVGIDSISGGSIDLADPMQALTAGIMGEFDSAESAVKSYRVKAAVEARRSAGKTNGKVNYGWRRESVLNERGLRIDWKDVVDERAAAIVREIAKRCADGEPVIRILKDLNARAIPTPGEHDTIKPGDPWEGSGKWTAAGVRFLATRPANIGKLSSRVDGVKAIVGDAQAPAIVDPAIHAGAVARFAANASPRKGREERRYLLSFTDWATCHCGGRLRTGSNSGTARKADTTVRHYRCIECGGGRNVERVDNYVAGLVIAQLNMPGTVAAILADEGQAVDVSAVIAERDELERGLVEASGMWESGDMDAAQFRAFTAKRRPRIDALNDRIKMAASRKGSRHLGPITAEQWLALDVNDRRALLEACRVTVTIHPSASGPRFKPETVEVTFMGRRIGVTA